LKFFFLKHFQEIYRKSPQPSPQTRRSLASLSVRKNKSKRIKKKDIEAPILDTRVHMSGAKMVDSKLTIIDNTGLMDPRVRKFLALAGITEAMVLNDPSKLKMVEKFANEHHIPDMMEKRKEEKKKRRPSLAKPTVYIPAPAPPPLPPPPNVDITDNRKLVITKRSEAEKSAAVGVQKEGKDMMEMIRSGSIKLKKVDREAMLANRRAAKEMADGELLTALQGALTRIESATGDSSEESSDDDWGEPQPAGKATKQEDELVKENHNSTKTETEVLCLDKSPPLQVQNKENTVEDSTIKTAIEVGEIDKIIDNEPSSIQIKTDEEITKKGDEESKC